MGTKCSCNPPLDPGLKKKKKTVKARVRGGGCGNLDVGCTSDNISGSILNSSRGDYRAAAVWENGLRKYDGALSKVS